jgi:hypothetical protein
MRCAKHQCVFRAIYAAYGRRRAARAPERDTAAPRARETPDDQVDLEPGSGRRADRIAWYLHAGEERMVGARSANEDTERPFGSVHPMILIRRWLRNQPGVMSNWNPYRHSCLNGISPRRGLSIHTICQAARGPIRAQRDSPVPRRQCGILSRCYSWRYDLLLSKMSSTRKTLASRNPRAAHIRAGYNQPALTLSDTRHRPVR